MLSILASNHFTVEIYDDLLGKLTTNIHTLILYTYMTHTSYKNNKTKQHLKKKKRNKLDPHGTKGQRSSKIMYTLSRTSVVGLMSTQIGGIVGCLERCYLPRSLATKLDTM